MLQRLIIMLAFCLPLLSSTPGQGAEQKGVTTFDAEGLQLQALKETESKLSALATFPADGAGATQKAAKPKGVRRKAHRKGHRGAGAVQAAPKPVGRRLTMGEVQGILAGNRDFSGADLSGLDLEGLDLSGANFSRADLERANLSRADLSEADLQLADLSNANFTRASLHMARLRGTRIWGARFDGALWTDRTLCRSGSLGRCRE